MKIVLGIEIKVFSVHAVLVDIEQMVLLDAATWRISFGSDNSAIASEIEKVISEIDMTVFKPEACIVSTNRIPDSFFDPMKPRVGLILIGYNQTYNTSFVSDSLPVAYIRNICGGHYASGVPIESLGIDSLKSVITEVVQFVDAFAVSSYAGVSNREHEETAGLLIQEMCSLPVWRGTDLSDRYHALRRVNTAVLSAVASPAVNAFISTLSTVLNSRQPGLSMYTVHNGRGLISNRTCETLPLSLSLSSSAAKKTAFGLTMSGFDVLSIDVAKYCTTCTVTSGATEQLQNNINLFNTIETCIDGIPSWTVPVGYFTRISLKSIKRDKIRVGDRYATPITLAYERDPMQWENVYTSLTDGLIQSFLENGMYCRGNRSHEPLTRQERAIVDSLGSSPVFVETVAEKTGNPPQAVKEDLENLCSQGVIEAVGVTLFDLLTIRKSTSGGRFVPFWFEKTGFSFEEFRQHLFSCVAEEVVPGIESHRTQALMLIDSNSDSSELEKMIAVKAKVQYLSPVLGEFMGALGAAVCPASRRFVCG